MGGKESKVMVSEIDTQPPLTLEYFPLRGLGFPIRFAASELKIPLVWRKIEDYEAFKARSGSRDNPAGQAPLIHVGDELTVHGFTNCMSFLQELCGFRSVNERVLFNSFALILDNIHSKFLNEVYMSEKDQNGKFKDEVIKAYLDRVTDIKEKNSRIGGAHFIFMENFIQRNGGGKSYILGRPSVADYMFTGWLMFLVEDERMGVKLRKLYPNMFELFDMVTKLESAKEFIKSN